MLHDNDRMRAVFQEWLRPADGSDLDVRSCESAYVRESPSRSVHQYTLSLLDHATGRAETLTVIAVTFGDERTHYQWDRVLETFPDVSAPVGPFGLPAATYVAPLDLILEVFPFDSRLPGLPHLMAGRREDAALLFGAMNGAGAPVEGWDAELVRYRPDMRATVRLRLHERGIAGDRGRPRHIYAKVYREADEGQRAFRLLEALLDQTTRDRAAFSVANPLAYHDALQTLLVDEVSGDRLLHVVRRGKGPGVIAAVRRAARAVADMHQVALPEGLLPQARRDKRAQLMEVGAKLARKYPHAEPELAALVVQIVDALGDLPPAPTHFDLKQGHILLNDDQVVILDFDKMAIGDPLVDVGNIVATLGAERNGSEARTGRRAVLTDAFVDEYFAHVPAPWRAAFPAYFALAALIEAGTSGRGQRGRPGGGDHPDWLQTAMTQARRSLDGDLWPA